MRHPQPLVRLVAALTAFGLTSPSAAHGQASTEPCSLTSLADVSGWTGTTVNDTRSQGNLTVYGSCTYGTVDGPPVLTYIFQKGAGEAADAYSTNDMWSDGEAVSGLGAEATWIPSRRMLAVLVHDELYVLVRLDSRSLAEPDAYLGLARQIATELIDRLDG